MAGRARSAGASARRGTPQAAGRNGTCAAEASGAPVDMTRAFPPTAAVNRRVRNTDSVEFGNVAWTGSSGTRIVRVQESDWGMRQPHRTRPSNSRLLCEDSIVSMTKYYCRHKAAAGLPFRADPPAPRLSPLLRRCGAAPELRPRCRGDRGHPRRRRPPGPHARAASRRAALRTGAPQHPPHPTRPPVSRRHPAHPRRRPGRHSASSPSARQAPRPSPYVTARTRSSSLNHPPSRRAAHAAHHPLSSTRRPSRLATAAPPGLGHRRALLVHPPRHACARPVAGLRLPPLQHGDPSGDRGSRQGLGYSSATALTAILPGRRRLAGPMRCRSVATWMSRRIL